MGVLLRLLVCASILSPAAVATGACAHELGSSSPRGDKLLIASRSTKVSAEHWNNRGVDLFVGKKYQDAVKAFDKAIELNPKYTEAYCNRGAAFDGLNNPERAVQDYSAAINLNPKLTQAYVNRASANSDLGRFDKSIEDWNVVIKRTPRDAEAYNKRGLCYKSLGDLQHALSDFEKAVSLNHHLSKAISNRDLVRKALHADVGDLAASSVSTSGQTNTVSVQSNASASQPKESAGATALPSQTGVSTASAASIPGKPGAAASSNSAAAAKPSHSVAAVTSGEAEIRATVNASPSHTPVGLPAVCANVWHHMLGNLLANMGQFDAAAANFTDAIQANPNDQFAYYRRANAYVKAGHFNEAIFDYESALSINPRFKQARAKRDRLLRDNGASSTPSNGAPR